MYRHKKRHAKRRFRRSSSSTASFADVVVAVPPADPIKLYIEEAKRREVLAVAEKQVEEARRRAKERVRASQEDSDSKADWLCLALTDATPPKPPQLRTPSSDAGAGTALSSMVTPGCDPVMDDDYYEEGVDEGSDATSRGSVSVRSRPSVMQRQQRLQRARAGKSRTPGGGSGGSVASPDLDPITRGLQLASLQRGGAIPGDGEVSDLPHSPLRRRTSTPSDRPIEEVRDSASSRVSRARADAKSRSAAMIMVEKMRAERAATAAKAAAEAGAHESELDEVRDEVAELAALQAMRCQAIAQTAPATGGSARRSGASNDDEGPTPAATSTITKLQRKQCVRI